MGLFEFVSLLLQGYPSLVSFILGMASQELLVFISVHAGAHNIFPLKILIFGLLGSIMHDTLVFLAWHSFFKNRFAKINRKRLSSLILKLEELAHKRVYLALFLSKFIYGARIAMVAFVANKEKNYFSFMKKNAPMGALALFLLIGAGWLTGQGFTFLLTTIKNLRKLAILLLASMILFILAEMLAKKIIRYLSFKFS